ncbi:hypothetical protein [Halalkalicoccus tibetensis]|uniref:TAT (Twin-arginine translocation) pathway signal sequence n=1 Tax=Halalkalicoccus tibetensis TaxID=175632 RepID=A0ABD5VBX6_9EURY
MTHDRSTTGRRGFLVLAGTAAAGTAALAGCTDEEDEAGEPADESEATDEDDQDPAPASDDESEPADEDEDEDEGA